MRRAENLLPLGEGAGARDYSGVALGFAVGFAIGLAVGLVVGLAPGLVTVPAAVLLGTTSLSLPIGALASMLVTIASLMLEFSTGATSVALLRFAVSPPPHDASSAVPAMATI